MPSADAVPAAPPHPVVPDDAPPAASVDVRAVSKTYPARRRSAGPPEPSVCGLSLHIQPGEIYGLLGPNGAGKSTLVRMISTLLEPTSGSIRVCGLDVTRERRQVRAMLGVALGGERSVYWKLTARQNLEFFTSLHGISRRAAREPIMAALEQVDLADRADDHIERWSTGMRQRLVLARALVNAPRVLLLDEPSSGLDPRAAEAMHELIRRARGNGHTILLTTHDMTEADLLSDRIGIINHGRLVGEGTPSELKRAVGAQHVVRARIAGADQAAVQRVVADLGSWSNVQVRVTPHGDDHELTLLTASADVTGALVDLLQRHGTRLFRIEETELSLREVFLLLTGRRFTRDGSAP